MTSDRLWLTKTESAELCGISVRQWSDAVQPRLLESQSKGKGKGLRFWAPAVVAVEIARQVSNAKPAAKTDDDPLLDDNTDSPALERYRLAMAKLREKDLAERDAELVRKDVILAAIGPALSSFRTGTDRMRRQFGNEAGDAVNEMVDELGDAITRAMRETA